MVDIESDQDLAPIRHHNMVVSFALEIKYKVSFVLLMDIGPIGIPGPLVWAVFVVLIMEVEPEVEVVPILLRNTMAQIAQAQTLKLRHVYLFTVLWMESGHRGAHGLIVHLNPALSGVSHHKRNIDKEVVPILHLLMVVKIAMEMVMKKIFALRKYVLVSIKYHICKTDFFNVF